MFRRTAVALLAALIGTSFLSVASPQRAHATVPGLNGNIAFTSDVDGRTEIYTVNADGTGVTQVTDFQAAADSSWSPDGTSLSFAGGPDPAGIYTVSATGGSLHRIADGSFM